MTCRSIAGAIVCSRASRRPRPREALECRGSSDCGRKASQASWGCRHHFFKLPPDIRNRLWRADRDERACGAGVRGRAWRVVDEEAQDWLAEQAAKPPRADRRQPELPLS